MGAFAMGSDALYVYDATTSHLIRRVAIADFAQYSSEHCLPDMAIAEAKRIQETVKSDHPEQTI